MYVRARQSRLCRGAVAAVLAGSAIAAVGQAPAELPENVSPAPQASTPLMTAAVAPYSVSAQVLQAGTPPSPAPGAAPFAPRYAMNIGSDERAQPLRAGDKVIVGLHDLYSPLTLSGILASAGYGQLVNGAPNYGTDRGAFGQRLGAAGARDVSQGLLTNAVFAPLLHQDPRYYALGEKSGILHRAAYAATRTIISRTDSGHATINGAMLLGYAGTAGVNFAYYPQINRNFKDTATGYGGSLGGAAIGYVVTEFSDELLHTLHLRSRK